MDQKIILIKNLFLNQILSNYKKKFNKNNHFFNLIKNSNYILCGQGEAYYAFERSVINVLRVFPKFIVDSSVKNNKNNKLNFTHLSKWDVNKINKYSYVICVGRKKIFREIQRKLISYNIKKENIIWVLDIYEFNIHHWDNKYAKNYKNILKNKTKIIKAYNLLEDKRSKKIFLDLLSVYISHKPKKILFENPKGQYFPGKIFKKKDYEYFVNCGAFTGDTFDKYFIKYKNIFKQSILIEPDPKNFNKLKKNIKNLLNDNSYSRVDLMNIACSSKKSNLSFIKNKGLSSRIVNKHQKNKNIQNLIQVPCLKLDTILAHAKVDNCYICIDSEGHEKEIVNGAKNLIKNEKINLGVSVYHKIQDIWEIPLLINNFSRNYKLFLRNYSGFVYETILYAKK